jgi:hypothetical protein
MTVGQGQYYVGDVNEKMIHFPTYIAGAVAE